MAPLPPSLNGQAALEVAREAAIEAGRILMSHFSGEKDIRFKGQGNLVTAADLLSEKDILGRLKAKYPDFGIISEESEAQPGSADYTWLVDPMDGSNNFGFGLPIFSISIALAQGDDILLGLLYDPLRQEMFTALRGAGAFLNGQPIAVSPRQELATALVGFDMGYVADKGQETLEVARFLRPRVFSYRILGSGALALAYVACGRLDIYMHRRLYPWDIAAGRLLVEMAGGVVTDWQGRPLGRDSTEIVAGNRELHRKFMQALTGYQPGKMNS